MGNPGPKWPETRVSLRFGTRVSKRAFRNAAFRACKCFFNVFFALGCLHVLSKLITDPRIACELHDFLALGGIPLWFALVSRSLRFYIFYEVF